MQKTGLKYENNLFIFNFSLFLKTVSRHLIIIDLRKIETCRKGAAAAAAASTALRLQFDNTFVIITDQWDLEARRSN